jgi:lipopolysaccharide transport system ATP-binding protein
MTDIAIRVEDVSKRYRLGLIGSRTLSADLERWWAKVRGRPDPLLKIGQEDYAKRQGAYIRYNTKEGVN